jgi:branched-chain amino acid transport system substrate-binding protein
MYRSFYFSAACVCMLFAASPAANAADPGVGADKIVFGQAAPLSGAAAALGTGMRDGILAAFGEVNAKGGLKGHKLELVSKDDGYEPSKSIEVTKQLLNDDKVFALIGPVGTPTSMAVLPITVEGNVPFIGAFTGTGGLRSPYKANVVNVRASYGQETEEMVERLTKDLKAERISIFYQDDSFGQAGLAGVKAALDKRSMKLVSEGTYERNTTAVRQALLDIRKGNPQAIIMVGAYQPCAEFIKLAKQLKMESVFVNISFVGSNALATALGDAGPGVVVTQVVPFPDDARAPIVAAYQKAIKAVPNAEAGFVSLEGYMVGRLVIMALEKVNGEPTRKALLDALSSGTYDLGGIKLTYGANDNQGSDEVFLTIIDKPGHFKAVKSLGGTS